MAFKVTRNHWEIFVNFMESHPELAKGRVGGPTGKGTCRKLWAELALQLNAVGEGERTVQKWQKTWTDFKYMLKRKAGDANIDLNATGGGPPKAGPLNDFEIRILNILGSSFYEGLGRPESGITFMRNENAPENTVHDENTVQDLNNANVLLEPSYSSIVSPPSLSAASKEVHHILISSSDSKKRPSHSDHDYIKTSKLRKKVKSMESMYEETLSELNEIKSCLKDLAASTRRISSSLDKIAQYLCNSVPTV